MISMYSEQEDVKNNAMPPRIDTGMIETSVISTSLDRMREQVKGSLEGIELIDWGQSNS